MQAVARQDFDLPKFYREQGYTVLEWRSERKPSYCPWMMANCIGSAKKMLGINAWRIVTPYQLYRYMRKRHA